MVPITLSLSDYLMFINVLCVYCVHHYLGVLQVLVVRPCQSLCLLGQ